jgi:hypothetical protein
MRLVALCGSSLALAKVHASGSIPSPAGRGQGCVILLVALHLIRCMPPNDIRTRMQRFHRLTLLSPVTVRDWRQTAILPAKRVMDVNRNVPVPFSSLLSPFLLPIGTRLLLPPFSSPKNASSTAEYRQCYRVTWHLAERIRPARVLAHRSLIRFFERDPRILRINAEYEATQDLVAN